MLSKKARCFYCRGGHRTRDICLCAPAIVPEPVGGLLQTVRCFVTSAPFGAVGGPPVEALLVTVVGRGGSDRSSVLSRVFHLAVQLAAATANIATDRVLGRVRRHVLNALLHARLVDRFHHLQEDGTEKEEENTTRIAENGGTYLVD
uniref:Uncharacterized protein n=1 Tax=Anopheles maculatus TaxID=74869 RepID=A0A182T3I9_9DIPT